MAKTILRICITTKDIIQIEECSQRSASQKMSDMRVYFNKTEKKYAFDFRIMKDSKTGLNFFRGSQRDGSDRLGNIGNHPVIKKRRFQADV